MRRDDVANTLSDDELTALSLSAVRWSGNNGITTSDVLRVCEWAHGARVNAMLLEMVLAVKLDIGWNGTEVVFAAKRGGSHAS